MRAARFGLLAVVIAMAAASAVTHGLAYWQTRRFSAMLVRAEADALFDQVRDKLRGSPMPPSEELVRETLERGRPSGLQYVAIVGADGSRMVDAAAEGIAPAPSVWSLSPGGLAPSEAGRVRALSQPLPSFSPEESLSPSGSPSPLRPPRPVVRAPPRVGIEFVPVLAPRLSRGAHAMLAVALATVGVLAALSVAALRLLGFRDALVRRLEQERRLASIGQMSAVLAHEIRNPLAALKGHSQLLAEALPEAGRERARADRVVREAVRLEALTTDLLAFVRSGTISPVEVDPARLVRETADEIAPGRIDIDEAGAPARWRLDPVRMKQALSNVLENAVHASPDGARVRAVVRQDGAALAFEVRDSGEGIPAGQEELIFEPFQTRKARGTGLGLAVARRIVALHGGSIGARNDPGGGAVFSITLP